MEVVRHLLLADRGLDRLDDEIRGIIQTWLKRGEGKCSKQPMVSLPLRQVYRQFDFAKGGPVRDLLVPVVGADELPAGQPLLIPVVSGGAPGSIPPPRPAAKLAPIPVEELA